MKKLIRAGEITPVDVEVDVPDPTPPKPKPVLLIAGEWRKAKRDEYCLLPYSQFYLVLADQYHPAWVANQIIDPPLVTAEQFEALAEAISVVKYDSFEYRSTSRSFGNPVSISAVLTKLSARARECGLTNGVV